MRCDAERHGTHSHVENFSGRTAAFSHCWIRPNEPLLAVLGWELRKETHCLELLRRPEVTYQHLLHFSEVAQQQVIDPQVQLEFPASPPRQFHFCWFI